jgi:hypothetical protein
MKKARKKAFIALMLSKGFDANYARVQHNFICSGIYGIAVPDKALRAWLSAGGDLPASVKKRVTSKVISFREA